MRNFSQTPTEQLRSEVEWRSIRTNRLTRELTREQLIRLLEDADNGRCRTAY